MRRGSWLPRQRELSCTGPQHGPVPCMLSCLFWPCEVIDAAMEAGAEDVQADEGEAGGVEGFKVNTLSACLGRACRSPCTCSARQGRLDVPRKMCKLVLGGRACSAAPGYVGACQGFFSSAWQCCKGWKGTHAKGPGLSRRPGPQVLTMLEDFAAVRDSVLEQGLAVDPDSSGPVYLPLMTIEV